MDADEKHASLVIWVGVLWQVLGCFWLSLEASGSSEGGPQAIACFIVSVLPIMFFGAAVEE